MRSVWRLRNVTIASLLVLATLLLLARGADEASAAPFFPSLDVKLPVLRNAPANVPTDIVSNYDWLNAPNPNRQFPASVTAFTPASWGMPAADTPSIPIGTRTATANTVTTFGLLNSPCLINIPIAFAGGSQPPLVLPTTALLDASTDPLDVIPPGAGFANLIDDSNPADGIMDGAQHWNTLLAALPSPRERQVAATDLFGITIWVDILTYDPGVIAPVALGFATLFLVQNLNPALPAVPILITDLCGLSAAVTQQGFAANGAVHRTNPAPNFASGGTEIFFLDSTSDRDADLDLPLGLVNSLDTCPYNPNVGDTDGDTIDDPCDLTTFIPNADPEPDLIFARGDNCPQATNPAQFDTLDLGPPDSSDEDGPQPVDGGPPTDNIGNACDLDLVRTVAVADGHFHKGLKVAAVCITAPFPGFSDPDGDGWCSATEVGALSDPNVKASTPEALSIPTTCSDGDDNDGILDIDLADTKCQLPSHDIVITSLKAQGQPDICTGGSPNNEKTFKFKILNDGPAASETVEVGFLVDAVSAGGSGPIVTDVVATGSITVTVTASGPINIDGDTDVEWFAKATVSGLSIGNTEKVKVNVTFPACGAPNPTSTSPPDVTSPDYLFIADVCHADDIAPLGLSMLAPTTLNNLPPDCAGSADGGQDLDDTNDPATKLLVNDVTK